MYSFRNEQKKKEEMVTYFAMRLFRNRIVQRKRDPSYLGNPAYGITVQQI